MGKEMKILLIIWFLVIMVCFLEAIFTAKFKDEL